MNVFAAYKGFIKIWQALKNQSDSLLLGLGVAMGSGFYLVFSPSHPSGIFWVSLAATFLFITILIKYLKWLNFPLWMVFFGLLLGLSSAWLRVAQVQRHQLPGSLYSDGNGVWATGTLTEVTSAATPLKVWLTLTNVTLYAPESVRHIPTLSLNVPKKRLDILFPDNSSLITDNSPQRGVAAQILLFGPEGKRFAGDRDDTWFTFFNGYNHPRGFVRGGLESTYIPPIPPESGPLSYFSSKLDAARHQMTTATAPLAQGALSALLIGAPNTVPYELYEAYRTSGLLHLLVISGTQMSLVAGGVFLLVRWGILWLPFLGPWFALRVSLKAIAATTALVAVTGYALLVGGDVSVLRALLMVALGLAALVFGRTHDMLRLWALSFTVLLLLWPEWIMRAGFQLSFAAVGGLLLYGIVRGEGAFKTWYQKVWGMAESTLVASLSTAPILAAHFGAIPLAGILANLIAIPLMTLATWLGFIALLIWPLGLQNLALGPMEFFVANTNMLAIHAANWPYATVRLGQPPAMAPFSSKSRDEPQGGVSYINGHYVAWEDTNPRTLRAFQRRWGIDKIEMK